MSISRYLNVPTLTPELVYQGATIAAVIAYNVMQRDKLEAKMIASRDNALSVQPNLPKLSYIEFISFNQGGREDFNGVLESSVGLNRLSFHVTREAGHDFASQVTKYPVEADSDITDHIVVSNPTFTVNAMFSNPSKDMLLKQYGPGGKGIYSQEDAYKVLRALRDNRITVNLVTQLGENFRELVITSLSFPKTVEGGKSVNVDITFEQIRTVETQVLPVERKPKGKVALKQCAPKVDSGAKPLDILDSVKQKTAVDIAETWKQKIGLPYIHGVPGGLPVPGG